MTFEQFSSTERAPESFSDKLNQTMTKAMKDLDTVMARHVNLTTGAGAHAASLIREKMAQVGQEAKYLGEGLPADAQKEHLKRLDIALHALSARAELIMTLSGRNGTEKPLQGKVETTVDAENLLRLVKMIQGFSTVDIWAGDRTPEALGEPDNAILRKLAHGDALDSNDLDRLADQTKHLRGTEIQKNPLNPRNTAIILLTQLEPKDRMEVLKRVVKDNPAMVVSMAIADYITIAQAEELLKDHPNDLAQLKRPETIQARDQVVLAANRRLQNVRIFKGNKNPAAELLSFKGLASTAIWLNGIATTAVNLAVNIGKGPGSLENYLAAVTSPGTWMGIAQIGIASEVNNGMGGIFKRPSVWATEWMRKNPKETGRENRLLILKDTARSLSDHAKWARDYAAQAEEISRAYANLKKRPRSEQNTENWRAELGQAGVTSSDKRVTEQFLKWAILLENNHGLETAQAQKDFIEKIFIQQGLPA